MLLPDNCILVRKGVKHARLRVDENSQIRLIVPLSFSDQEINSLLDKKRKWINKNINFFESMTKIGLQRNQLLLHGNRYNYFYDNILKNEVIINHEFKTIRTGIDLLDEELQERWLKGLAKGFCINRLLELSERLSIPFNRHFIRNQKNKFGNCSKEKNISLNWRLIKAPMSVLDYIIVHELIHTLEMNHSKKFWSLVRAYYPDYKDAIEWLEKYGNSI